MSKLNYLILISCLLLLSGCGVQVVGYIVDVEDDRVLVALDLSSDEYETIQDKPLNTLFEEYIHMTYYSYSKTEHLNIGDKVKIWTDGMELQSYPPQAIATKIKVIQ